MSSTFSVFTSVLPVSIGGTSLDTCSSHLNNPFNSVQHVFTERKLHYTPTTPETTPGHSSKASGAFHQDCLKSRLDSEVFQVQSGSHVPFTKFVSSVLMVTGITLDAANKPRLAGTVFPD